MNPIKIILIIITFFLLNCTLHPQHLGSLKLKSSVSVQTDTNKIKPYHSGKNAFAAGALSLIVPGLALGQIYNGEWEQFYLHISISAACAGGTFISARLLVNNGLNSPGWYFVLLGATLVYTTNWVWSIIDAAATADEIDRQRETKKHSTDFINRLRLGFTLNKKLNLKFTLDL